MTAPINELASSTSSNQAALLQFSKENAIRSQKNIESLKSQIEAAELELKNRRGTGEDI